MITEEIARAAGEWWADKCGSPKFDNLGPKRGVDPAETVQNTLASMLMEQLAASQPDGNREAFIKALADQLVGREAASLSVDYGACQELRDAAAIAGMSQARFPWKTHMTIYPNGSILASCGYGAPREIVRTADNISEQAG